MTHYATFFNMLLVAAAVLATMSMATALPCESTYACKQYNTATYCKKLVESGASIQRFGTCQTRPTIGEVCGKISVGLSPTCLDKISQVCLIPDGMKEGICIEQIATTNRPPTQPLETTTQKISWRASGKRRKRRKLKKRRKRRLKKASGGLR